MQQEDEGNDCLSFKFCRQLFALSLKHSGGATHLYAQLFTANGTKISIYSVAPVCEITPLYCTVYTLRGDMFFGLKVYNRTVLVQFIYAYFVDFFSKLFEIA